MTRLHSYQPAAVRQGTKGRPPHPDDARHTYLSELSFTLLHARRRGRIDLARRLAAELTQPELDLALAGGRSA
jgi:hypothetical protein